MNDFFRTALIFSAGLSAGFGVMYAFVDLRRRKGRPVTRFFALFSLSYAAATLSAIVAYGSSSVNQYVNANISNAFFAVLAFIALLWFVANYTSYRPRIFLGLLTAVFVFIGLANFFVPSLLHNVTGELTVVTLPWGETAVVLDEAETALIPVVILAQLTTIGFISYATIRQFRRGERRAALILSIGVIWFVATLLVDITVQAGVLEFVFLSDFGFLGFTIAMSLQLANQTIQTEEELAAYRLNLEDIVAARSAELEAVQDQLMAQARESAVIEERGRLARELHDVVTQILFSINLIAMSLPRLWQRDPVMAESSTNELQRLTRGALAEMRILLRELRPHTIVATDLEILLTQLGHSISARHDIPCELRLDRQCAVPAEVHIALYRIAQEAMNNITKHAEANAVALSLICSATSVTLRISDDGVGFDQALVTADRMGLDIMKERAAAIGAELTVESRPATGTAIAVRYPVNPVGETVHA